MKKILSFLLALSLVFGSFAFCFAEGLDSSRLYTNCFLVEDLITGEVLAEKNADEPMYIASLTKMMTALVAMDYIRQNNIAMSEKIVTDDDCLGLYDSFPIKANESYTWEDAINLLLVKSVNGLGVAIAKAVAGTEETFCSFMNTKANELGCTDTHFANAHGLDDDKHWSTARDLSIIAAELMKDEYLASVVAQESYDYSATNKQGAGTVYNTNALLSSTQMIYVGNEKREIKYTNANILGVKTGTEDKAGNCLIAAAEKDGTKILVVILKSGNSTFERYADAHMMLDWAFNNFKTVKLASKGDVLGTVKVKKGEFNKVAAVVSEDIYVTLPKEAASSAVTLDTTLSTVVKAPFESEFYLGEIAVMESGERTMTLAAVSQTEIEEGGFLSNFYIEDARAEKIFKVLRIIILIMLILVAVLLIVRAYNKQQAKKRKAAKAKRKAQLEAQKRKEWNERYDQDHDRL